MAGELDARKDYLGPSADYPVYNGPWDNTSTNQKSPQNGVDWLSLLLGAGGLVGSDLLGNITGDLGTLTSPFTAAGGAVSDLIGKLTDTLFGPTADKAVSTYRQFHDASRETGRGDTGETAYAKSKQMLASLPGMPSEAWDMYGRTTQGADRIGNVAQQNLRMSIGQNAMLNKNLINQSRNTGVGGPMSGRSAIIQQILGQGGQNTQNLYGQSTQTAMAAPGQQSSMFSDLAKNLLGFKEQQFNQKWKEPYKVSFGDNGFNAYMGLGGNMISSGIGGAGDIAQGYKSPWTNTQTGTAMASGTLIGDLIRALREKDYSV